MSGSKTGGGKYRQSMIKKYGSEAAWKEHLRTIGAKGGKNGNTGGFAAGELGRKRASAAGTVGGTISRRGPKKLTATPNERQVSATQSEVNRQFLALPGTHAADLEKDKEADEIIEKVTRDIMSLEEPKRTSFFDRFKKAKA